MTILYTFLSMHSYVGKKRKPLPIKIKFNAIATGEEREFLYWIKCYFLSLSYNFPHPLTNIGPYQVYCNSISFLSLLVSTLIHSLILLYRFLPYLQLRLVLKCEWITDSIYDIRQQHFVQLREKVIEFIGFLEEILFTIPGLIRWKFIDCIRDGFSKMK